MQLALLVGMDQPQKHEIEVDGIPMRWLERGRGTPVVLVHGIPTGPQLWRHVIPRIAGARVLAWEMVGYASSIPAGEDRDISVGKQADYLAAWMQALGITRAILVGHDLGGGVVQIAAVRQPLRCMGMFLTNAIGYDSWPIPSVRAIGKAGVLIERTPKRLLRLGMSTLMSRGHDNPTIARESLDVHFEWYAEYGAGALVRQARALDQRDTLEVQDALPSLRPVPARVVWGEDDQFQKIGYGVRFARDLDCELIRIPGAKHFTPEDHPEVVAASIEDLIREVKGRPTAPKGDFEPAPRMA